MSLSMKDINRTMLVRSIEQLRYENKLLKAHLMNCSKRTDKEEDDEGKQPPSEGGEDEPLPPWEGTYDETFPANDSWFDIGS